MMEIPLVWVVDDDNLFFMITRNNLRKTGIETTTELFSNGLEALHAIQDCIARKKTLPRLIILDLNMPLFDGWSFLDGYEKIDAGIRSQIKIYICTSSIDPNDIAKANEMTDVLGFLEKPLQPELLLKLLLNP